MQLWRRIFRPTAEHMLPYEDAGPAPQRETTILDLFRTDLRRIVLAGFTEGKAEVLMNGDIIRNFYKTLDYKEYGIFDTVGIRIIGGKSVNAVLKSTHPGELGSAKMKKIIDALYEIYGNDSSDKGRFNEHDASEYTDSQLHMLFGRDWMDYPRYEYPVSLRRYPEEVFLSIWGLTDKHIVF